MKEESGLGVVNDAVPLFSVVCEVEERNTSERETNLLSLSYGRIVRKDPSSNEGLLPESFATYQIVRPGDTVLRLTDLQNDQRSLRTGFVTEQGMITSAYLALRPTDIEPRYLSYVLHAHDVSKSFYAMGGGLRQSIKFEDVKRLPIPFPTPSEQRRIAGFLDDQVARIDKIIDGRRQQIELEREWYEHFREARIEGDAAATRVPLIHLTQRDRPINYGVLMPGPRLEAGVPLIEAGDVMRGPIELGDLRLTDPVIEADYSRSRLRMDDLVMAIRGSIGAVQVVPDIGGIVNVTRDAARISVDRERAVPSYLRHAMSTLRVRDWFGLRVLGSAVTGINIGDLRKVPVVAPGLLAQEVMAREIDAAEQRLVANQRLMQASASAFVELKRSLITSAVTGEFEVSSADGSRVPV